MRETPCRDIVRSPERSHNRHPGGVLLSSGATGASFELSDLRMRQFADLELFYGHLSDTNLSFTLTSLATSTADGALHDDGIDL
jgi:hypothetical protein